MAVLQIYDQLLQFPLFQGMSRDDLEIVAGHTRFGFSKFAAGKQIVKDGEACTQLYFLINGAVKVVTASEGHDYWVVEQMSAPYILQQDAVFGYHQRYTSTFTAFSDSNFIVIDKEEIVRLSEDFLVFRLNMLNAFATQAQKLRRQFWRREPESLRERVIRFFLSHCVYPAGVKEFHILMTCLADQLNDSRLNVSRVLNQLEREGLITLTRGCVTIPQLERLLMQ